MVASLDPENARLSLDSHECLNHEVLPLIDEALSYLTNLFPRLVSLLESLQVLPSGNLLLLLDLFALVNELDFVLINIRVILAHLPDNVRVDKVFAGSNQESLINLEELPSDICWHFQVVPSLRSNQQELPHIRQQRRSPDEVQNRAQARINLLLEVPFEIWDNVEMWMTDPRIYQPFIQVLGFF